MDDHSYLRTVTNFTLTFIDAVLPATSTPLYNRRHYVIVITVQIVFQKVLLNIVKLHEMLTF